jgi:hypothetical protein
MREDVWGSIVLGNNVDITDPSFDEDVWCRINNFPIQAGEYECYVLMADDIETGGYGNRVARIGIRTQYEGDHYERKGIIGVDSGLAGFFNCDNKLIYDDIVENHPAGEDVFIYDNAFVSSTGYGDAGYEVWAGYSDGEIVDIYIEFISSSDLESNELE